MVSDCGSKKSGKINGAQETKSCREVKGQEEDEQCGAREISQQWENLQVAKFSNLLAKFRRLRISTTCEVSQVAKIRKPGNFNTALKTHSLQQYLQKRKPKNYEKTHLQVKKFTKENKTNNKEIKKITTKTLNKAHKIPKKNLVTSEILQKPLPLR